MEDDTGATLGAIENAAVDCRLTLSNVNDATCRHKHALEDTILQECFQISFIIMIITWRYNIDHPLDVTTYVLLTMMVNMS